jgi:nucleoside-diphosphate-sugar epimerase
MMDALVIGSTSVVGQAITLELSALGSVRTAGRREADIPFDLAITDPLPIIGQQFDVVVLASADFGGSKGEDLVRATQVNVLGAITAARLAESARARHFVLISSLSACCRPGDHYYNAYALTKAQSEQAVSLYCGERSIGLSIVRLSQVFDSEGKCRLHQPLLYKILDCARSGKDFTINGLADPLRNFIHLSDVANLVKSLVMRREVGTYVCAQTVSLPISFIAETAYSVFGNGGRVRFDSSKPNVPELPPILDPVGTPWWSPSISIEEGFHRIRELEGRSV